MAQEQGERLAAYLADALDSDERTSVEAALAGDPALRSQLARLRRLQEQLTTMPEVAPSAEFSAQLRAALTNELATSGSVVDLGAARRRRRWVAPAASLATAAAAVAGVIVISNVGSGNDAEQMATGATDEMAGDGADSAAAALAPTDDGANGPFMTEGGEYDAASLTLLGEDLRVLEGLAIVESDPAGALARAIGRVGDFASAPAAGEAAADEANDADAGDADALDSAPMTEEAEAAGVADVLARCLGTFREGERVPIFADLGTYEGESALITVLASRDAQGEFNRLEFWVLDPQTCDVRHFAQVDR